MGHRPSWIYHRAEGGYDRYHLPIMISENGIGLYDELEADGSIHDTERIRYYEAHIAALAKAVEGGAKISENTLPNLVIVVSRYPAECY